MKHCLLSLLFALALSLAACGGDEPTNPADIGPGTDTSTDVGHDTGPDADGSCIPDCNGKECGDNGCGGECGPCDANELCTNNSCICNDTVSDQQLCVARAWECGAGLTTNACNEARSFDCGQCPRGGTCGEDHRCIACVRWTRAEFCAHHGAECDPVTASENCDTEQPRTEDCGSCPTNYACSANQCRCTPETDAELIANRGYQCGTAVTADRCASPRRLTLPACAGDDRCEGNKCVAPGEPPANDDCAGAIDLAFFDDERTVEFDTTEATDSTTPSCGDALSGGRDVVFKFELTEPAALEATLSAQGADAWPVLSLRKGEEGCAEPSATIACAQNSASTRTNPLTLRAPSLEPGLWYLWVDGHAAANFGVAELALKKSDLQRPANDKCADAEPIELEIGDSYSAAGFTVGASNDLIGDSGALEGDVLYELTLLSKASVRVTAQAITGLGHDDFQPMIVLKKSCSRSAETLAESASNTSGAPAQAGHRELSPGTYYIVVSGHAHTTGHFTLTVEAAASIDNVDCSSPAQVTLTEEAPSFSVLSSTSGAGNSADAACGHIHGSGSDLVWEVTVSGEGTYDLRLDLTPSDGSLFKGVVVLRSACRAPFDQLLCAPMANETTASARTYFGLAPGTYIVWVDSLSPATEGEFTLGLELENRANPPPHSVCAGAVPLDFTGGATQLMQSSSTHGGNGAHQGTCGASAGAEVIYEIITNTTTMMTIGATSDSTDFAPTLYLRSACGDEAATSQLACAKSVPDSSTSSLFIRELPAGHHWLFVDGAAGREGTFELYLYAHTPPLTNATCSTAKVLTFTEAGTLTGIGDTAAGGYNAEPSCRVGVSGRDLVYELKLPESGLWDVRATLSPAPGSLYTPMASLRTKCASNLASDQYACVSSLFSMPIELAARKATGSLFLWVDMTRPENPGAFQYEITIERPTLAPNDTCSPVAASALVADGTVHSFSGDTLTGADDFAGSCGGVGGGDLVHYLDLSIPGGSSGTHIDLMVTLTTPNPVASRLRAMLYLRESCALEESELGCAASSWQGESVVLTRRGLAPGRYALIVDSASPVLEDEYELSVRATESGSAPFNDKCDSPFMLTSLKRPGDRMTLANLSTLLGQNDYSGHCGVHDGADLAFQLTLETDASFSATLTPSSVTPGYTPALYLVRNCGDTSLTNTVACGTGRADYPLSIAHSFVPAGTYRLVVDGAQQSSGVFDLGLSLGDPVQVPDSCFDAELVHNPFDMTLRGTTLGASDNAHSSTLMASTTGPDTVYLLRLGADLDLYAELLFASTGGNASLYLRRVCDSAHQPDEIASATAKWGGPAKLSAYGLVAGDYWLWVDGSAGLKGEYELYLTASEHVAIDACGSARVDNINLSTGSAKLTGLTFEGRINLDSGACHASRGPERIFKFTVPQGTGNQVTAEVNARGTSFPLRGYLRTSCADSSPSSEIYCPLASGPNVYLLYNLPLDQGTYYLFVDTADETGVFDLSIKLSKPAVPDEAVIIPWKDSAAACESTNMQTIVFGTNDREIFAAGEIPANGGAGSTNEVRDCGLTQAKGWDQVIRLNTSAVGRKRILISAATTGSTHPVLFLQQGACSPGVSHPLNGLVGCAADTVGTSVSLSAEIDGGIYYLWIDTMAVVQKGPYQLSLRLFDLPSSPALNATCGTAISGSLDVQSELHFSGYTDLANDDFQGYCGIGSTSHNGPNVYYSFFLPSQSAISALVTPTGAKTLKPAITLFTGSCETPVQKACSSDGKIVNAPVPGGSYWAVVDGLEGSSGSFDLKLTAYATPEGTTTCVDAPELTFTNNLAELPITSAGSGTNTNARTACGISPGHELIYKVRIPSDGKYDFYAEATALGTDYHPALELRSACDQLSTSLACDSDESHASLRAPRLSGGTYYLVIDSTGTSANGLFRLSASRALRPSLGDIGTCDNPLPLDFSTGNRVSLNGVRYGDTENGLSAWSRATPGSDLVYTFTITTARYFTALAAPSSNLALALYLRGESCTDASETNEVACRVSLPTEGDPTAEPKGVAVQLSRKWLMPGTYHLVIDSLDPHAEGTFSLIASLDAVGTRNSNDTCLNPEPLDISSGYAETMGSLDSADDDATGYCGEMPGPDLVYKLHLTTAKKLKIEATTQEAWAPALYLRRNCGDYLSQHGCERGYTYAPEFRGWPVILTVNNAAEGDWFLWVDTRDQYASGAFHLTVTATAPVAPPTNDTCANPMVIHRGTQLMNQSTANANDDYLWGTGSAPGCHNGSFYDYGGARDLVYVYTPDSTSPIFISMPSSESALSGYRGFWVSTTCGARATCIGGAGGGGTERQLTITNVVPYQPYYIHVDMHGGFPDVDFNIQVQ